MARFLFRKGGVELILYLQRVRKANYCEILRQDFVRSRGTFSDLMKEFEEKDIVVRELINSRPPRVEYSLTDKGKKIAKILDELNEVLLEAT
jgi:DNA-binding HxlR family transcriptional regulator